MPSGILADPPATPPVGISASIPRVGPSGVPSFLIIQNQFGVGDPRNEGGPGGTSGAYRVVFTLCRPTSALRPDDSLSFESGLEGDSHLAISPPALRWPDKNHPVAVQIQSVTPFGDLRFRGIPNRRGFLGKLVLESLLSTDLKAAQRTALAAISSFLSASSVYSDIPLEIYQADVTELRTGNTALLYVNSYRPSGLGRIPADGLHQDFRLYASLYREALNSNNQSYQFLCFFKIIEGIRLRNERRSAEALAAGLSIPSRPREIIPDAGPMQTEWLNALFPASSEWDEMTLKSTFVPEAVGKKLNRVVDDYLLPIRTRIAHTFLDSGEPTYSIDESSERNEILHWLPLEKCIARAQMKNEFPDAFLR